MFYKYNNEEIKNKYKKIYLSEDYYVYFSKNECFYGKAPCTHYKDVSRKLMHEKFYNYNIIKLKK